MIVNAEYSENFSMSHNLHLFDVTFNLLCLQLCATGKQKASKSKAMLFTSRRIMQKPTITTPRLLVICLPVLLSVMSAQLSQSDPKGKM